MAFSDWSVWLFLPIEFLLLIVVLYASVFLFTERKKITVKYFFRLFMIALVFVLLITALAIFIVFLVDYGVRFAIAFYAILTIIFLVIIRHFLIKQDIVYKEVKEAKYWRWSIWITLICVSFISIFGFVIELIGVAIGTPLTMVPFV